MFQLRIVNMSAQHGHLQLRIGWMRRCAYPWRERCAEYCHHRMGICNCGLAGCFAVYTGGESNVQNIASTAWACATADWMYASLCVPLAGAMCRHRHHGMGTCDCTLNIANGNIGTCNCRMVACVAVHTFGGSNGRTLPAQHGRLQLLFSWMHRCVHFWRYRCEEYRQHSMGIYHCSGSVAPICIPVACKMCRTSQTQHGHSQLLISWIHRCGHLWREQCAEHCHHSMGICNCGLAGCTDVGNVSGRDVQNIENTAWELATADCLDASLYVPKFAAVMMSHDLRPW